ncbi:MAG TPA: alanine--tRNA ligase, partial [Mucilaginibacter sp.]|nr:alanine--tRNA ligase [Mucilaginibacter sp.]
MTAAEIRSKFLEFFKSKGHQIVPSAPIVVKNDPTLMFTNAGMNQFKDIFLGEAPAKYPRVADTQRCLRVSGKHNDLEEVGIDTYHHTMFEMLGNWSFGDYFKKEAIEWSWELLTEVYKIDKSRLYVTIFEGDEKEGLPKDQEAFDYWKQYVPENHILLGNKNDNFWEMGETGPCGPCSEIHYDNRSEAEMLKVKGERLVNQDDPQVIEIWNNVFIQFNRLKDSSLQPLPAKHVDTGMGFERLVRVLQGKSSNYDTDVFSGLIQFISEKSKKAYNSNAKPGDPDWNTAVAMRVLADHVRAVSFTIADGQLPSNNKAGYVIRRILRRAVRYQYQYLGFKEPFLNTMVPMLAEQFHGVFDELWNQKDFVQRVVLEEETSFLKTLENGINRFDNYTKDQFDLRITTSEGELNKSFSDVTDYHEARQNKIVSGDFAFELSDTYGFPLDLTMLMAREKGWRVDLDSFEKAMQAQKARSRAATTIDTGDWVVLKDDDTVQFTGYDETETIAHIVKYRKVTAKGKEQYQIVLDKTPFYAESGGQVGDTGQLVFPDGEIIQVTDTKKENALIVHFVDKLPSDEAMEDALTAIVDPDRRHSIEGNHS